MYNPLMMKLAEDFMLQQAADEQADRDFDYAAANPERTPSSFDGLSTGNSLQFMMDNGMTERRKDANFAGFNDNKNDPETLAIAKANAVSYEQAQKMMEERALRRRGINAESDLYRALMESDW